MKKNNVLIRLCHTWENSSMAIMFFYAEEASTLLLAILAANLLISMITTEIVFDKLKRP